MRPVRQVFRYSTVSLKVKKPPWPLLQLPGPKHVLMQKTCALPCRRTQHQSLQQVNEKSLRESENLVLLKDGKFSGLGNEAVKRKVPLVVPKEDGDDENPPTLFEQYQRCFKSSINDDASSVYVEGFLWDAAAADKKNVGQISLEQFLKPYGSVSDHSIKYVYDAEMWLAEVSPKKSSQGIWIRTGHTAVTFVRWWNQVKSGHQLPNEIIPVVGAVASHEVDPRGPKGKGTN